MLPVLEEEWGYTVYLQERDFPLGSTICDEIYLGLTKSRKVVLIVTNAFIENEMCEYASQLAVHRGYDSAICIILETLPPKVICQFPLSLRALMDHDHYLRWLRHGGRRQRLFWTSLHAFLKARTLRHR